MQSDEDNDTIDGPAISKAFCKRVIQNVLVSRLDRGLDALQARRLQSIGLLENAIPPQIPPIVADVLRTPAHTMRVGIPQGPLLFVREGATAEVIEAFELLLNADADIRSAVIQYMEESEDSATPWLTAISHELIKSRSEDIRSTETERWRAAAIELVPMLRVDLFSGVAALRQSLAARYKEGIDEYLLKVFRPSFAMLSRCRPPLWCATQQVEEIEQHMAECAALPTISECLTGYLRRYGSLPLCERLGSAEQVAQWVARHPGGLISWDDIWNWAESQQRLSAKYHALVVGLVFPSATPPAPATSFWQEILDLISVRQSDRLRSDRAAQWMLYCELAAHYIHHIEALHPGQSGECTAAYAWWLSEIIGTVLLSQGISAQSLLEQPVRQEGALSFNRWNVARSPSIPSPLRYATLFNSSIWAISLLQRLSRAGTPTPPSELISEYQRELNEVFGAYVISSPLTTDIGDTRPVFGFQDNSHFKAVRETSVEKQAESNSLRQLLEFRHELSKPESLKTRLVTLLSSTPDDQRLVLLFMNEMVFSTAKYDDAIFSVLADSMRIVEMLQKLPDAAMHSLLEALNELQQRYHDDWAIRLPHIVAYAIETSADMERVRHLLIHALLMSINVGIVSPIQRLLASRWRTEAIEFVKTWRENLIDLTPVSEPWVGARIRATSAAISRAIGPRVVKASSIETSLVT